MYTTRFRSQDKQMCVHMRKKRPLPLVTSYPERVVEQVGCAVSPYNHGKILPPMLSPIPLEEQTVFYEKLIVRLLEKYSLPLTETKNSVSL